jgi:hypothetical protein
MRELFPYLVKLTLELSHGVVMVFEEEFNLFFFVKKFDSFFPEVIKLGLDVAPLNFGIFLKGLTYLGLLANGFEVALAETMGTCGVILA